VNGQTSESWVFAGGDAVTGPSSVIEAIAAGEKAAVGIDLFLSGTEHAAWRQSRLVDTFFDPDADPVEAARAPLRLIPVARRKDNFDEVESTWTRTVALAESKRCLRCDYREEVR
jgi:NADH-quinone oxidoreductase subunit F